MPLKKVKYQDDTVAALRLYLATVRTEGPVRAFAQCTTSLPPAFRRSYTVLADNLADSPYVCLRLPTGGGKTLLAARAISVAGRELLDQEFPLVLWLVPTNTIREQTILALRTPGNMHRDALADQFKERVQVLDVKDFAQLRPQDLGTRATIVVSTLATARVDATELRNVYAHNEDLEPFFATVPPATPGLERDEKKRGRPIKCSFVNLLHFCRPLVIVDEAHNNKSPLSTEVMARINPSCIIEFTATPAPDSNILHHVPATELQAADMIKLPIELTQHATWQEAIHKAAQERQKLAELAADEPDYIRPIVLIQAENIDKAVTWQVVLDYLQNSEGISRDRIAVATGAERELDGINLFARSCPIEFVITVKALKEGWDCSFAYVFCSVATVHSKTEVEQLLGRVLRMPYARRRKRPELNRAYAHVSSESWPFAVEQLRDRLVDMGFDEVEAEAAIREQRPAPPPQLAMQYPSTEPTAGLPLFEISVREKPDLSELQPEEAHFVTVHEHLTEGLTTLVVDDTIPEATLRKLERQMSPKERKSLRETLAIRRRQRQREHAPARQGKTLRVPQLVRVNQGDLELVEHDSLISNDGWDLGDFPATLSENEFSTEVEAKRYEIAMEGKRLTQRYLGAQMTLDLKHMEEPWSEEKLIAWLDERIQHPLTREYSDVGQTTLRAFIRRAVRHLTGDRRLTLADLQLYCYPLQKSIERKIAAHRQAAYRLGFQDLLALPAAELITDFAHAFEFPAEGYAPKSYYQGARRFNHHFYPDVGAFDSDEERDCAVAIDECPDVDYWVRNLDHGDVTFRLPRSPGYFYPDFVAQLKDGRTLIVEYKGAHLEDKTSEQEKRDIGNKWAERSQGKSLFLWAVKEDAAGRAVPAQLRAIIGR